MDDVAQSLDFGCFAGIKSFYAVWGLGLKASEGCLGLRFEDGYMAVSIIRGTPIYTPKSYNPQNRLEGL